MVVLLHLENNILEGISFLFISGSINWWDFCKFSDYAGPVLTYTSQNDQSVINRNMELIWFNYYLKQVLFKSHYSTVWIKSTNIWVIFCLLTIKNRKSFYISLA